MPSLLSCIPVVPFEVEEFYFPNLRSLHLAMDCGAFYAQVQDLSYRDHIRIIPKVMLRFQACNLLALWLSFNGDSVRQDPEVFLDYLGEIIPSLETLIRSYHPCIRTITIDVGSSQDMVAWWTAALKPMFAFMYDLHADVNIHVLIRRFE